MGNKFQDEQTKILFMKSIIKLYNSLLHALLATTFKRFKEETTEMHGGYRGHD